MKYQKYNEYEDSKLSWLGKKPKHWKLYKLKYLVNRVHSKTIENGDNFRYVGLENIQSWKGKLEESYNYNPDSASNRFFKGDVLFGKLRPYLAKAFIAEFDGLCSSELLVLRTLKIDNKFLLYFLLSQNFISIVDSSTYGSKMPRANWEFISNLKLPLPNFREQQSISKFLDRETSRIDALIEKKQKLIELLKEKRTALITKAVTKGLYSNVKMKDSGIEWLGEIPEHWDIIELKRLFKLYNGSTPSSNNDEFWNGRLIWITPDDLGKNNRKYINDSQRKITYKGYQSCGTHLVPADSIIISTRAPIGHISLNSHKACTNQGCKSLVPQKDEIISSYYYYYLYFSQKNLNSLGKGSTFMELSANNLGKYIVPQLPVKEQKYIASYLDRETKKIDDLICKIELAITKHKEYRTALISAAVTGKIKVPQEQKVHHEHADQ